MRLREINRSMRPNHTNTKLYCCHKTNFKRNHHSPELAPPEGRLIEPPRNPRKHPEKVNLRTQSSELSHRQSKDAGTTRGPRADHVTHLIERFGHSSLGEISDFFVSTFRIDSTRAIIIRRRECFTSVFGRLPIHAPPAVGPVAQRR
jgi:hypothetical protein